MYHRKRLIALFVITIATAALLDGRPAASAEAFHGQCVQYVKHEKPEYNRTYPGNALSRIIHSRLPDFADCSRFRHVVNNPGYGCMPLISGTSSRTKDRNRASAPFW
jgi:hypothetical protein